MLLSPGLSFTRAGVKAPSAPQVDIGNCVSVCACVMQRERKREREFTCCVEQTDIKTTLHAPNTTEVHMAPAASSASYTNSVNTIMLQVIHFTLLRNNSTPEGVLNDRGRSTRVLKRTFTSYNKVNWCSFRPHLLNLIIFLIAVIMCSQGSVLTALVREVNGGAVAVG